MLTPDIDKLENSRASVSRTPKQIFTSICYIQMIFYMVIHLKIISYTDTTIIFSFDYQVSVFSL